ncbi:hypothetical protein KUV85_16805 [Nocardioides panacisoli]|uniref:CAF17-like 4Fe-4S cluster assembly/insertion protein YgfZ n=1 Tax=Nocardioides panacisoli TaxID=627624 RepID=UPI001C627DC9|nr:hypothetical protein [Nocardioides panacisoli]QYJ03959.1 hypothetical protein KUV85_16805 [Nocardioides panacisoli]
MTAASPLLGLPGAVASEGIDAPVAAHYGSLYGEQTTLAAGDGFVDLSHRDVVRISGPDRLTWLHSLTTQSFEGLPEAQWTDALILSPQGKVEHAFTGVDDGESFTAHTEPGRAAALIDFLESMKFMTRVEIADVTDEVAVAWRPETPDSSRPARFDLVPRDQLEQYAAAAGPAAGLWAYDALRIERGEPRFGVDTDDRTIPNEVGWLHSHVHLDKGCYRGQETVARVHNLGKPPRRLAMLHLDGSENRLPAPGTPIYKADDAPAPSSEAEPSSPVVEPSSVVEPVETSETSTATKRPPKQVGVVGSSARHHELGPIALAILKRNVPTDAALMVDDLPAAQEVVVDPEVGLHFRHR